MTEAMVDDALVESREAAASWLARSPYDVVKAEAEMIRLGYLDGHDLVQAFIACRLAGVAAGREEAAVHLEAEAACYRHVQDNANSPGDKLYRMGQKDACLLEATAIRQRGE